MRETHPRIRRQVGGPALNTVPRSVERPWSRVCRTRRHAVDSAGHENESEESRFDDGAAKASCDVCEKASECRVRTPFSRRLGPGITKPENRSRESSTWFLKRQVRKARGHGGAGLDAKSAEVPCTGTPRPLVEPRHLEREALRTRHVALVRGHGDHAIDECAGLCGRSVRSELCACQLEIPSFTRPHPSRVAQVLASLRCHDRPVKHLFAKRRCTAGPARRLSRAMMFWTGCRGAGSQWHRSQRKGSRRE